MAADWETAGAQPRASKTPGMHIWLIAVGATQGALQPIHAARATLRALRQFWSEAAGGLRDHRPAAAILTVRLLEIGPDCDRNRLLDLIDAAIEADDIRADDVLFFYWLSHAEKIDRDNHILYLPALARPLYERSRETAWLQHLTCYVGRRHPARVQYYFFDCCSTTMASGVRVPPPWPDEPDRNYDYKKYQRIFVGSGDGRFAKASAESDKHHPTLFASSIMRLLDRYGANARGEIGDARRFLEPLASLIAEEWLERNYDEFPDIRGIHPVWSIFVDEIQPFVGEFRSFHEFLPFGRSASPAVHALIGVYSHRPAGLLLKCNGKGIIRIDPRRHIVRWQGEASHHIPFRFRIYDRLSKKLAFCPLQLPGAEPPLAVHQWHFEDGD